MNFFLAVLFMFMGHLAAWFAYNGQYAWESWKRNPLLTAVILGPLITTMFWWGSFYGIQATSSAWSVRFLGFATSYFVFPIMTYIILNESFMTTKTLICIALSFLILLIQLSGNK